MIKKYYTKLPILSGFLSKNWRTHTYMIPIFLLKTALKFGLYYRGTFFFRKKRKKKITAKSTHSLLFWGFCAKSIFSREIKNYETFGTRTKSMYHFKYFRRKLHKLAKFCKKRRNIKKQSSVPSTKAVQGTSDIE